MSEQPKEEKTDSTHINLKVSDGTAEIFFKIKKTTPMKRLMEAFCKRQGKSMESLRFLIDGTRVSPDNTPEDLDLEDGDVIEAHREQSWTGCGSHVSNVMDSSSREDWCTCEPIDDAQEHGYPPRAGTGFAKASPPK
ncbi:ubiquitin-like protein SMT3 [Candidozyma haemuli]|uniref:Ubiquitin-like protein SMT3 n=1 Tax=Candidozyma haemuli TaxID=45357 RepID=A0A2V1AU85_9ASCO|nr:ubiquitin-like protein SMT3 [[Candida] haemuloni]PVH21640.1 ubiquitin-like protein SMT3 [[Candida] haemuloni]